MQEFLGRCFRFTLIQVYKALQNPCWSDHWSWHARSSLALFLWNVLGPLPWCSTGGNQLATVRPITTYKVTLSLSHTRTHTHSHPPPAAQPVDKQPHHIPITRSTPVLTRKKDHRTPSFWGKWTVLPKDDPQTIITGNSNAKCIVGTR